MSGSLKPWLPFRRPSRSRVGEDLLTVRDVAEWLRIPVKSVYNLFERGELPGFKIGRLVRFYPSDITMYLSSLRIAA